MHLEDLSVNSPLDVGITVTKITNQPGWHVVKAEGQYQLKSITYYEDLVTGESLHFPIKPQV